jgi:hypothetical protein
MTRLFIELTADILLPAEASGYEIPSCCLAAPEILL